jgi:hypothetical protein
MDFLAQEALIQPFWLVLTLIYKRPNELFQNILLGITYFGWLLK